MTLVCVRGTIKHAGPTRQTGSRSIAYLFRFLHIHRLGLLVGKAVRYEQARQWVVWLPLVVAVVDACSAEADGSLHLFRDEGQRLPRRVQFG